MMRSLYIPAIFTLILAAVPAQAGDGWRSHGSGRGQHLIVPPGSKVIIIPPAGRSHGPGFGNRFDRHDWRGGSGRYRHDGPGRGTRDQGPRFVTPGFGPGWTTTNPRYWGHKNGPGGRDRRW